MSISKQIRLPPTPHQLSAERLFAVIETQNEIASARLDLQAVMELVARRARALTGAVASVIELPEGGQMVYRVATGTAEAHLGLRLDIDSSLSGRCLVERRVLRCDNAATDPRVDVKAVQRVGAIAMVCVPLLNGETTAGVLKVYSPQPNAFDDADVETLELLSGVIAAHMAHAASFEAAHRESRQDPLTGVGNRRAYDERVQVILGHARRHGRPVALCLFDVDHFKEINDRHGHPAGDAVLAAVGAALRKLRVGDEAFRVGGDEFAALLPDTVPASAAAVARRVTEQVLTHPVRFTLSYGCAASRSRDAASLYAAADEELYAHKAARL